MERLKMKKHLIFYGLLILIFVLYNFLFKAEDPRADAAISIVLASILFGYIAWMAFMLLRKMKKK